MLTPELQAAFQQSRFISYLDPEIKTYLLQHAEVITLPAYTYLHRKGDAFCGIYCLLAGKMKATGVTERGNEYSMAHIMPGAVIGEIAYLDAGDRTHDAQSLERSTLVRFNKDVLDNATAAYPAFYSAIVHLACMHIRQAFSVLDDFLTLSPEQRLAKKLLSMGSIQSRFRVISINQHELAAWVGVSRQSISKILNRWQAHKMIAIEYKKLTLLQPEKLEALYAS
ncbi:Crp/Fnr family transcriptional regulator [Alteromonas sediminis]|uniref:Crp/Fnr family transcriptional regulator n=1 Tax=Alteromonas sediminis TaxID=2259342 RepID=A0A3N5Y615_9ALTE|nr:Crp/Fnr family transcriptional regulator [Alteromonas sediminis]RPJ68696.1 Crp/Fnr family transcriptional regulator [Alteromonas sediminis]